MKKLSVKLRITLWLTVLTAALSGLMLVFMLGISSRVVSHSATEQLQATLRSNLAQVDFTEGSLRLGDGFSFYHSGVSTLIYSKNEALLAGQVPVSFTADEPFLSGELRGVESGGNYLVLDLWLPSGWEDGVWIRGLLEAPDSSRTARNILEAALIALPLFVLFAAIGSYRIAKRAFRPLDSITATAESITEARDLSRRIGIPPARDEFSRLAAAFDRLFERLERSFEAEKRFAADASHELRTPVSIIKGACEYAEKYDETEDERRETLEMIHRQADKMSGLISQLLSMTRLEQGTETVRLEPLELGALAAGVCAEQGYDAARLSLEADGGVVVSGDPALLGRLLQNLVGNAFKYGRDGGRVWVSVGAKDGEALLSVRDDGVGIPAGEQEKIWQRFYQVDASRGDDGGAGLGLAMVRQIAQLHGGHMTLESVPGVGSVFTLHLPLKEK